MIGGKYVYDFVVTGICTSADPSDFKLLAIMDERAPIERTSFFDLWRYADNCDLEIEITTKFDYYKMIRSTSGIFSFAILGVTASDAATIILKFGDSINRDH